MKVFCSIFVAVQLLSSQAFTFAVSGGYGSENSIFTRSANGAGSYGSSDLGGSYVNNGGGMNSFAGAGSSYGKNGGGGHKGPVEAAVESHRTVEVKPVQSMSEPHEPQVIEVPSDDMPVTVHFKSQSSRVLVQQTHTPAKIVEPEHTSSEDEPQRVIHEVLKPVIQEIREVIQPYRRLIQQVQPVIEQTHTVIAKGEPRPQVQPLSVPGASGANSAMGGGNGANGFGSDTGAGKFSGNHAGNYAASASTVSLKSVQEASPSQRETIEKYFQQQPQQQQAKVDVSPRAVSFAVSSDSVKPSRKWKASKAFAASSSVYSSRRGDFGSEARSSQTRMSLRPAPANFMAAYKPAQVSYEGFQPIIKAQHAIDIPVQQESYLDMAGGDENIAPFMTFIAQPVRFRARARA